MILIEPFGGTDRCKGADRRNVHEKLFEAEQEEENLRR